MDLNITGMISNCFQNSLGNFLSYTSDLGLDHKIGEIWKSSQETYQNLSLKADISSLATNNLFFGIGMVIATQAGFRMYKTINPTQKYIYAGAVATGIFLSLYSAYGMYSALGFDQVAKA